MRRRWILIVLAGFIIIGRCAKQNDFPVLKGLYLGQKPPGMQRIIFAPGIVSTGYNEHAVSFTPDGNEIFYRLMGPPHGVVLTMREEKGTWTPPRVASFSGKYDGKCSLSPDGNTLLISCGSPPSGEGPPLDYWTIWIIKRTHSGWGNPQNLSHLRGAYPTMSNRGTIYFYARGKIIMEIFIDLYILMANMVKPKKLKHLSVQSIGRMILILHQMKVILYFNQLGLVH